VVGYGLGGRDVKGLVNEGPLNTIWFERRLQALDFSVAGEDAVLWVAGNITARHQLQQDLADARLGIGLRIDERQPAAKRARACRWALASQRCGWMPRPWAVWLDWSTVAGTAWRLGHVRAVLGRNHARVGVCVRMRLCRAPFAPKPGHMTQSPCLEGG